MHLDVGLIELNSAIFFLPANPTKRSSMWVRGFWSVPVCTLKSLQTFRNSSFFKTGTIGVVQSLWLTGTRTPLTTKRSSSTSTFSLKFCSTVWLNFQFRCPSCSPVPPGTLQHVCLKQQKGWLYSSQHEDCWPIQCELLKPWAAPAAKGIFLWLSTVVV